MKRTVSPKELIHIETEGTFNQLFALTPTGGLVFRKLDLLHLSVDKQVNNIVGPTNNPDEKNPNNYRMHHLRNIVARL